MIGIYLLSKLERRVQVMIQAGDFIDTNLGVTFALSTLTAAGLDVCDLI